MEKPDKNKLDLEDMNFLERMGYFAARGTGKTFVKSVRLVGKGVGAVGRGTLRVGKQAVRMVEGVVSGAMDEIEAGKKPKDDADK